MRFVNKRLDLLKRTVSLYTIKPEPISGKRNKEGETAGKEDLKSKSQLEFERDIEEKPVITDVKLFNK